MLIDAEYRVVKARSPGDLADGVNGLLMDDDWKVQGGIVVDGATLMQVLVLRVAAL